LVIFRRKKKKRVEGGKEGGVGGEGEREILTGFGGET